MLLPNQAVKSGCLFLVVLTEQGISLQALSREGLTKLH